MQTVGFAWSFARSGHVTESGSNWPAWEELPQELCSTLVSHALLANTTAHEYLWRMARKHHVVSAGYLRYFADDDGLVRLWKKSDATVTPPIPLRHAFFAKGFNTFLGPDGQPVDQVEHDWSDIEGRALPAIRAAEQGDRSEWIGAAIKAIAAMHFARSFAYKEVSAQILQGQRDTANEFEARANVWDAFVLQFGRPPKAGEITRETQLRVDIMERSNIPFVSGMARIYMAALGLLEPLYLEFARPRKRAFGFVTGDNPFVLAAGTHVGIREGVALGTAGMAYLPLSRWLAVNFTEHPLDEQILAPSQVQVLNHYMWRSCQRQLAFHPQEDFPRALAITPPPDWPPPR